MNDLSVLWIVFMDRMVLCVIYMDRMVPCVIFMDRMVLWMVPMDYPLGIFNHPSFAEPDGARVVVGGGQGRHRQRLAELTKPPRASTANKTIGPLNRPDRLCPYGIAYRIVVWITVLSAVGSNGVLTYGDISIDLWGNRFLVRRTRRGAACGGRRSREAQATSR